jgi:TolB-like protein/Flp pilus assembly protein TadD
VIPLENLSADSADEYFADGLTDELIRNLSIIDGLAVRSRTSSFALRGNQGNVHEAGRQLDVDYILEGSVLRAGQQLRINAQFIRVRDDFALWSGKFDKELTDVFGIQEEISRGIVNSLRLKLGRGRRRYETSIEAYDLYLRARALHVRLGLLGYRPSIPLLEEAVRKDPSFAPAYAGLVDSYVRTTGFKNTPNVDDMLARMRAAADRAIQLDPLLAEAHAARALAYARDANWEQSERSFRRAIELDPNRSMSRGEFAMNFLVVLGRIPEAIQQLRAAQKSDPLSPETRSYLSFGLLEAARFEEAESIAGKLPDDFPQKSEDVGRALLGQGKIAEAIPVLAKAGNKGYLGIAYARAGRREEAEDLARKIAPNPFNEALVFTGLGDKDRALEALERFTAQGPVRIGRALNLPELASLRRDPRVKAIRRKVGLPQ